MPSTGMVTIPVCDARDDEDTAWEINTLVDLFHAAGIPDSHIHIGGIPLDDATAA